MSNLCHAANPLLWLFEISDLKGWLRFSYDLQFIPRRSRREKGDVLTLGPETCVGKFRGQEAQIPESVLFDRDHPARIEVIDEAVEKVFDGGVRTARGHGFDHLWHSRSATAFFLSA